MIPRLHRSIALRVLPSIMSRASRLRMLRERTRFPVAVGKNTIKRDRNRRKIAKTNARLIRRAGRKSQAIRITARAEAQPMATLATRLAMESSLMLRVLEENQVKDLENRKATKATS
ncbi:hypothetical protein K438DRAFT_1818306 [Mycena galopus ATCC 62051]|nr:hypothetical protein K438DRAFT_1818306 [Mycena galopus ATCC 62051]